MVGGSVKLASDAGAEVERASSAPCVAFVEPARRSSAQDSGELGQWPVVLADS